MKLYTKTGDSGQTSVIGGTVAKHDIRVEAYGTIDEANAFVGQAISQLDQDLFSKLVSELVTIQHELFDCGSDLASIKPQQYKATNEMVDRLEAQIDAHSAEAPKIERFILPGGAEAAATLHICRTVTRRAERQVSALQETASINPLVLTYLNRLSDYFFLLLQG